MGEAGLFGIICLCHRLRMSVAKFCEVLRIVLVILLILHYKSLTCFFFLSTGNSYPLYV